MVKKKQIVEEDFEEKDEIMVLSPDDDYTTEIIVDELELELTTNLDEELLEEVYEEEEDEFSLRIKSRQNKHRQEGKHSLKHDSIFYGKLSPNKDPYDIESCIVDELIEHPTSYDPSTRSNDELYSNDRYVNNINLYNDIHDVLEHTYKFDFAAPRRKPNKKELNKIYKMLCKELFEKRYTRVEIFVELAYYFTDNIFNMYKLLEPKYSTAILRELKDSGFIEEASTIKFF